MQVRRVVTGHTSDGKSVFVSDGPAEEVGPTFARVWANDGPAVYPNDGTDSGAISFFPSPGGVRVWAMTLGARASASDMRVEDYDANIEAQMPGLAAVMDPDDPGMHTTGTTDFVIVLSGEITLELDDGAERTVGPGGVIVQNGTRHRWHNRGDEPVVIAAVLVGAVRAGAG